MKTASSTIVERNRRAEAHAFTRRLCLTILFNAVLASCKSGTPVTATQAVLDSADQVLLGMSHYVTDEGVLRARVRADTAYFFSNTQRAELRNVHVTFYDITGRPTSTLTSKEGTHHWRTGDMEARGNVVVVRDKDGGTMRTEVMEYNQMKNEVSSDNDFIFDAPDRHIEGRGFTSDPEFKKITAKGPRGTGGQFLLPNQ
ncbi:MAG TPA: LPS export ABC transporter periplasmic protein LptC [Gemmatimonadales bacterium]|jgi:LPS export ABC transporter protein LptC|nr:LPS export ABC transporter periplasmic protein LptC [Gemmatimonadales bacterium]